jgi:hypothetical protein
MSKLHTEVVPAQHNTRRKANVRQTDERWKKGDEGEEEQNSSLFAFSQIPSLLLVVNNSNLALSIFVDQ